MDLYGIHNDQVTFPSASCKSSRSQEDRFPLLLRPHRA